MTDSSGINSFRTRMLKITDDDGYIEVIKATEFLYEHEAALRSGEALAARVIQLEGQVKGADIVGRNVRAEEELAKYRAQVTLALKLPLAAAPEDVGRAAARLVTAARDTRPLRGALASVPEEFHVHQHGADAGRNVAAEIGRMAKAIKMLKAEASRASALADTYREAHAAHIAALSDAAGVQGNVVATVIERLNDRATLVLAKQQAEAGFARAEEACVRLKEKVDIMAGRLANALDMVPEWIQSPGGDRGRDLAAEIVTMREHMKDTGEDRDALRDGLRDALKMIDTASDEQIVATARYECDHDIRQDICEAIGGDVTDNDEDIVARVKALKEGATLHIEGNAGSLEFKTENLDAVDFRRRVRDAMEMGTDAADDDLVREVKLLDEFPRRLRWALGWGKKDDRGPVSSSDVGRMLGVVAEHVEGNARMTEERKAGGLRQAICDALLIPRTGITDSTEDIVREVSRLDLADRERGGTNSDLQEQLREALMMAGVGVHRRSTDAHMLRVVEQLVEDFKNSTHEIDALRLAVADGQSGITCPTSRDPQTCPDKLLCPVCWYEALRNGEIVPVIRQDKHGRRVEFETTPKDQDIPF